MASSTDNELILIGGHMNDRMAELLASRANGELGMITFGLADSARYLEEKAPVYASFGCKLRHIQSIDDLEGLSAVFYSGGDQNVLAKRLKETGLHKELIKWWRKGEVILAGSSGGAMVMCGVMLEDGSDDTYGKGSVELIHGLGPLGSVFVAPHWSEWATEEWRQEVVKDRSVYFIIGIDEATALVWRAGHCKVVGAGKVYLRGRREGEWSDGQEFDIQRGL